MKDLIRWPSSRIEDWKVKAYQILFPEAFPISQPANQLGQRDAGTIARLQSIMESRSFDLRNDSHLDSYKDLYDMLGDT